MEITIIDADEGVTVWAWVSLTNEIDPRKMNESFVIGGGDTRDEAVEAALMTLRVAAGLLGGTL